MSLHASSTMRDVARAVGVATSTVSKALRDDPTISPKRCRQIKTAARMLGYVPNPMIATLMSQLHARRRRNDPLHIAWIDLWPDMAEEARLPILSPLLRGAMRRAGQLGYDIAIHRVARDGISGDRLREILIARSQWSLIIPPVPEDSMDYPLDLQGLSAVTIGTSLRTPVMHRVAPNLYQGSQLACSRLRQAGFRRIGLVLSPWMHERVEGKWMGAYLTEQQQWPKSERLPPLIVTPDQADKFGRWVERQEPDAILLSEPFVEEWTADEFRSKSGQMTAWLLLEGGRKHACGVDYRSEKIGEAAVEIVIGQIHRNERGVPEVPNTLLMDGVWVER